MKTTTIFLLLMQLCNAIYAQLPNYNWAKSFGANAVDEGFSVTVDKAGSVYTAGFFQGVVDFNPNVGIYTLDANIGGRIFVLKLDSLGNFIWAKQIGAGSPSTSVGSITVDTIGHLYITGLIYGIADMDPNSGVANLTSNGGDDAFVCKLDTAGNFIWAKNMGGTLFDQAISITVDVTGNVYTTGIFAGTADFDPNGGVDNVTSNGGNDVFISKLNTNGNFVWVKSIGSINDDLATALNIDVLGNIYVTGNFSITADFDPSAATSILTSNGNEDAFILKLDTNGDFIWAKNIGGTQLDVGYSIVIDTVGNVYTTGSYVGTADFDPSTGVMQLGSATATTTTMFILKLNSVGNVVWVKNTNSALNTYGSSITLDATGNIYTTGNFKGNCNFDAANLNYFLTSVGNTDVFICKHDTTGKLIWAQSFGSNLFDFSQSIAIYDGSVYTTGWFNNTVDFDGSSNTHNLTSNGSADVFIYKMNTNITTATNLLESASNNVVRVYPNPVINTATIQFAEFQKNSVLQFIDVFGKEIKTLMCNSYAIQFSTDELVNGIYYLKIVNDNTTVTKKLIIQH